MVSPGEGVGRQPEDFEADIQLGDFQAFLAQKAEQPRRGDRYMAPLSAALYDELQTSPELAQLYAETLAIKYPNMPHLWQVSARAFIKLAMQDVITGESDELPCFPEDYMLPPEATQSDQDSIKRNWQQLIKWVVSDSDRFTVFSADIKNRNVQSNKFQRYVAVEAALHVLKSYNRLPEKPSILDIGCSQNHGNTVLASDLPFYSVAPADPDNPHDVAWSNFINNNPRIKKGRCDGVDIVPQSRDSSEWALFNSLYLDELQEPHLVSDYQKVDNTHPENVHFIQADFTAPEIVTDPPEGLDRDGYDVVTLVTVLYQLSPEKQERMIENALRYLKPGGFLIIQDFYERKKISDDPEVFEYEIIKDWDSRTNVYRTLIVDNAARENGPQEIYVWKNARCEQIGSDISNMGEINILLGPIEDDL